MRPNRAIVCLAVVAILGAEAAWALSSGKKSPEEETAERSRKATEKYNEGTESMHQADSLMGAGKRDKAQKAYRQATKKFGEALDLKPEFPEALNHLGYSLRLTGRHREALKHYDRAIELKPDYLEAHEYRARAYLALDRIDDARKEYAFLLATGAEEEAEALKASIDAWVLAKSEGRKIGAEKDPSW